MVTFRVRNQAERNVQLSHPLDGIGLSNRSSSNSLVGVSNQTLELSSDGTARLPVPAPGRVTFRLGLTGSNPRSRASVQLGTVNLVNVTDGQVFEIEVDADALATALEKVSK